MWLVINTTEETSTMQTARTRFLTVLQDSSFLEKFMIESSNRVRERLSTTLSQSRRTLLCGVPLRRCQTLANCIRVHQESLLTWLKFSQRTCIRCLQTLLLKVEDPQVLSLQERRVELKLNQLELSQAVDNKCSKPQQVIYTRKQRLHWTRFVDSKQRKIKCEIIERGSLEVFTRSWQRKMKMLRCLAITSRTPPRVSIAESPTRTFTMHLQRSYLKTHEWLLQTRCQASVKCLVIK